MNKPEIEEKLSRIADEIVLNVPKAERAELVAEFAAHLECGYKHVPHMAGYETGQQELKL